MRKSPPIEADHAKGILEVLRRMRDIQDPENLENFGDELKQATPHERDLTALLHEHLKKFPPHVQAQALLVFARLNHKEVIPYARALLNQRDALIVMDAAGAMAFLGEDDGYRTLRELAVPTSPDQAPAVEPAWVLETIDGLDDPRADALRTLVSNSR